MFFKRFLVALATLFALSAFAAVDANKGSQAELEAVKGIGPAIATKIVDERKKGDFKDWSDLITRVKGVGDTNAAKFSAEGLTVGGASYKGAAPAPKKDAPAKATAADKKPAATPAAAATPAPAAAPAPAAPASAADKKQSKKDKKKAAADAAASAAKK